MNNIAQTQPTTRPTVEGQRPAGRTGQGRGGFVAAAPVPAGTYRIVMTVDGKEFAQTLHVQPDPVVADAVMADENESADEDEEEEEEREREHEREIRNYEIDYDIGD
jgi:hypothetical protein